MDPGELMARPKQKFHEFAVWSLLHMQYNRHFQNMPRISKPIYNLIFRARMSLKSHIIVYTSNWPMQWQLSMWHSFTNKIAHNPCSGWMHYSLTLHIYRAFFSCFLSSACLKKNLFFQKITIRGSNQFGSISDPTKCRDWPGFKNVCKGYQQTTLVDIEFK